MADNLPAARMAEGLGYFGLMATLSMGLAPMIGIWLVSSFSYPVLFDVVTSMAVMTLLAALPVRSARVRSSRSTQVHPGGILSNLAGKYGPPPVGGDVSSFPDQRRNDLLHCPLRSRLHIGNVGPFFAASSLFMVVRAR